MQQAFTIYPSTVNGTVTVPPSKSHCMRAILLAALAVGESRVHGLLRSPDIDSMLQAVCAMGAVCMWHGDSLCIRGVAGHPLMSQDVHAGNSGQVLRFIAAAAAIGNAPFSITGDSSIVRLRPVSDLITALAALGATITSNHGRPPLHILGPIHPGCVEMNGADSQPVSALLMALSLLHGPSTLTVHNLGERPWIGLTMWWLNKLGAKLQWLQEGQCDIFQISGSWVPQAFDITVPADWSSAAFPLVAGILHGNVTLRGLTQDDPQGDKVVMEWLQKMGASIAVTTQGLHSGMSCLDGATIDANSAIDAVPILCTLAPYTKKGVRLENVAIARLKESDRIMAMATELAKMGAPVVVGSDWIEVGPAKLTGATLVGYNDHRIVMALTIAAIGAATPSTILGCECVAKSYPGFFEQLMQLGVKVEPACCPV